MKKIFIPFDDILMCNYYKRIDIVIDRQTDRYCKHTMRASKQVVTFEFNVPVYKPGNDITIFLFTHFRLSAN